MLLAGFEPEEESPIVFLRLRRAVRTRKLPVFDLAPFATRAAEKLQATVLDHAARRRGAVAARAGRRHLGRPRRRGAAPARRRRPRRRAAGRGARCLLRAGGAGPGHRRPGRLGAAPGGGARGRRGRRAADPAARRPQRRRRRRPGRRRRALGRATRRGARRPGPRHHRHPHRRPRRAARAACWSAASTPPTCPTRRWPRRRWPRPASWSAWRCSRAPSPSGPTSSSRSPRPPEKAGSYLDWEGRVPVLRRDAARHRPAARRPGAAGPGRRDGRRPAAAHPGGRPRRARRPRRRPPPGGGRRARRRRRRRRRPSARTRPCSRRWRQLLDAGTLQRDEPELAGTARPPVARIGADAAGRLGVVDGDRLTVSGAIGLGHPAGAGHRRCPTGSSGCR